MHNEAIHNLAGVLVFSLERNAILSKRPDGKFILRNERRLIADLKRIWTKQMNYIVEKLKNVSAFKQEKNEIETNALEDEVNRIVNNLPFKTDLAETVVLYMSVAMEKGGKTTVKKLNLGKFGVSFSLQNKKAIEFLNAKKTLELSNFRGNIDATTKSNISRILLDAAKSGQSYQKTAQLIMEQGKAGVFSPARGQLIATREIGVAYEKGNNIPIREFQANNPDRKAMKFWQTVEDDRVTEECAANEDGGWLPIDEAFDSGDDTAPRDGNPRCRCHTQYEIQ